MRFNHNEALKAVWKYMVERNELTLDTAQIISNYNGNQLISHYHIRTIIETVLFHAFPYLDKSKEEKEQEYKEKFVYSNKTSDEFIEY